MSEPKQVIVMRTDLGMRKGKMIAQGAHASISWLTVRLCQGDDGSDINGDSYFAIEGMPKAAAEWVRGAFVKICVRADSEEQLLAIIETAKSANVPVAAIYDAGRTEFHGEKTLTCCAIGPDYPERIDPITGHLSLL